MRPPDVSSAQPELEFCNTHVQAGGALVMSVLSVASGENLWRITGRSHDLAIPLHFNGPQPRHFDALPATATPMRSGKFTGDTRQGGSCNADVITLNAHCNGTHTECIGHVTHERLAVHEFCPALPILSVLVTIASVTAAQTADALNLPNDATDLIIDRSQLKQAMSGFDYSGIRAMIVRTLPNSAAKLQRQYQNAADCAYFTVPAIEYLIDQGIEHLLVDTPSIDRFDDDGQLLAHRKFFGLPTRAMKDKVSKNDATRAFATISEMIYAPDEISDGVYILNLQVPAFCLDAAPSRPLLYEVELESR